MRLALHRACAAAVYHFWAPAPRDRRHPSRRTFNGARTRGLEVHVGRHRRRPACRPRRAPRRPRARAPVGASPARRPATVFLADPSGNVTGAMALLRALIAHRAVGFVGHRPPNRPLDCRSRSFVALARSFRVTARDIVLACRLTPASPRSPPPNGESSRSIDLLDACGLSRDAVATRVKRRNLHPLHRGVYAVGPPDPPARARFLAAVMACGPTACPQPSLGRRRPRLLPAGTTATPRSRSAR